MLRSTTLVVLSAARLLGAQAPRDTGAVLDGVAREVARLGAVSGASIWPGYRPDTIPLLFVLPTHGSFLFAWRGPLPAGYVPVAGLAGAAWRDERALGSASTGTRLGGRFVAQVALGAAQPLEPASLFATAFHEAFHVFERASARPGVRFGAGENSMLIATYPVFDPVNETGFALEGRILHDALATTSPGRQRELAREFVGVRRERHRRLAPEMAEFDQMSELNEGLANYALVRAYRLLATSGPPDWRAEARHQLEVMTQQLADLTGAENMSLRFRFYQTGPALGLLLDALAGPRWKTRISVDGWALQDALGLYSGVDSLADRSRRHAESVYDVTATRADAERRIGRLRARRLAAVDSVLSRPGIRLVLAADSLPGRDFNACGYDPQNLLQVTARVQLHTRWWKPCAGGPTNAELNVPSVHDPALGTVSAVIGAESEIHLTSGGRPLNLQDGETLRDVKAFRLEAPRATVDAARADIVRRGAVITIYPKRAAP